MAAQKRGGVWKAYQRTSRGNQPSPSGSKPTRHTGSVFVGAGDRHQLADVGAVATVIASEGRYVTEEIELAPARRLGFEHLQRQATDRGLAAVGRRAVAGSCRCKEKKNERADCHGGGGAS